ncbi:SAM-dependent methyltransferase [Bacillus sp. T33-2]|uniref:SAM-dependent methyltransferase n=1 Tax=Bacillus sp. T33-2 TaxID=2054168 RepID=UPI000C76B235|nr:SAM-dependent methyltransferase [Bacillus sp. T33-2]PLR89124.1 SAM-dependent methyltransferase [Bacillus sp. T33-2]
MKEQYFDKLLNISTGGDQQGFNKSYHYHRYEPTPFSALEELFKHYEINRNDCLVDFGSGKGRLAFYTHYFFDATVTGIEMNDLFYHDAVENLTRYIKKRKNAKSQIHFHHCLAEEYDIDSADNRFYFFNPFSIQVFMKVVKNILISVEKSERNVDLILYFPSEDYIYFLENSTPFELMREVKLPVLSKDYANERFLIYRLLYA